MVTDVLDKVMIALELASQSGKGSYIDGWVTLREVCAYAAEAGIKSSDVYPVQLDMLVDIGRAITQKVRGVKLYRPVRGGTLFGSSNALELPREPDYQPGQDPRGGKPTDSPRDEFTIAAIPAGGAATGAASGAVGGTVRGAISNIM